MNVNFLRKFSLLVLLAVGWANFAWAQGVFMMAKENSDGTLYYFANLNGDEQGYAVNAYIKNNKCNNAVITLLQDYTIGNSESGYLGVEGLNATLDLNGHTLTTKTNSNFTVVGKNVTIIDSSKGKEGTMQGSNPNGVIGIASNCTLNVQSGILKSTASGPVFALTNNGIATLNITGGKIDNTYGLINPSYATGTINITGGSFTKSDDATLTSHINDTSYKIAQANPNGAYPYSVVKQNAIAVSFDENGNFLYGLANLLDITAAAKTDKATIRLLQDFSVPSGYPLLFAEGNDITLDVNGHTFKGSITVGDNNGTANKLTLTDESSEKTGLVDVSDYRIIAVLSNSELTTNVNIKGSGTLDIFSIYANGSLNIAGGKISNAAYKTINETGTPATISISGGYFSNDKNLSSYIADGSMLFDKTGDTSYPYCVIPTTTNVVAYGSDGVMKRLYNNLTSAFADENNGANGAVTVKAIQDITADEEVIFSAALDRRIAFDLNGRQITLNQPFKVTGAYAVLTLTNSIGTGSITMGTNGYFQAGDNGKIIVNDGTYIGGTQEYPLFSVINLGYLDIYNGKFKYTYPSAKFVSGSGNTWSIKLYGGYVSGKSNHFDDGWWDPNAGLLAENRIVMANPGTTVDATEYPWCISPLAATLTYGDGTTKQVPTIGGVVIDLADDNADNNAWVRKIDVPADYENVNVTIKKNFANTNWHAFSVPFDINVSEDLLENFEVAKIWDTELNMDNNSTYIEFIRLTAGESIPAFTPCLVRAKVAGKQDFLMQNVTLYKNATKTIDCSNVDEKFTFTGVMENTNINGKYALNSTTGTLVQATNANATLTPLKFYMEVESKTAGTAVQSRKYAVRVIGDETTGIDSVNAADTDATSTAVYNLQGVKVGTTTTGLPAGIYIQNGRKVVVR